MRPIEEFRGQLPARKLMDANFASAYRLMTSDKAREAFDLRKEPTEGPRTLRHDALWPMLSARAAAGRSAECDSSRSTRSSPCSTKSPGTFTARNLSPRIAGMKDIVAPMYDQGYSALHRRSRCNAACSTTRWSATSPSSAVRRSINPAGGRDHWPQCWTVKFAGGGVKGGRVVGKSDDIGGVSNGTPGRAERSCRDDLQILGVDLETQLPGPQGRPFPSSTSGRRRFASCFEAGAVVSKMLKTSRAFLARGITLHSVGGNDHRSDASGTRWQPFARSAVMAS